MKKGLKIFLIGFAGLVILGSFIDEEGDKKVEKIDTKITKEIDKDLIQFEVTAIRKLLIEADQLQYLNSSEVKNILDYLYTYTNANPQNKDIYESLSERNNAFKEAGYTFPLAYYLRALKKSFPENAESSFKYGFWMLYDLHVNKKLPLFSNNEFVNNNASSLTRRCLWGLRVIAEETNTGLGIANDKVKKLQYELKSRGKNLALGDIVSPIGTVLDSGENIKTKDIDKILTLYFKFVDKLPSKEVENFELSKDSYLKTVDYIYRNIKF